MTALLSIALIHFFAIISPGTDFFFVTQSAIRQSRTHALFAALGISLSILVWAILAISGLHFLFQKIAWLQHVLMVCGGLYLLYLGWQMLKSSLKTKNNTGSQIQTEVHLDKSHLSLLFQGFFTNMANPKALVYFSSVFALAIQSDAPLSAQTSLLGLIWIESLLWFSLVAVFFSWHKMTQYYQQFAKWIDGVTGGIFISFGCYLILGRD